MSDRLIIGGDGLLPPALATRPSVATLSEVLVVKFDPHLYYVHGNPPDWVQDGCSAGFFCLVGDTWHLLSTEDHDLVYAALSDLAHCVLQVLTVFEGEKIRNGKR